ncbi:MAG TPA: hypothetical protein VFA17_00310 [Thermoplasmata archaeon]|jgi:vacuolar-type H+-ATPase subunit I/STV1|nr:hypothetical protein [Thermoplasmata archaeon]
MVEEGNLDLAIHHVERVLTDQLDSVDSLSNKASVALGFVLTAFGALFALSREAVHAHIVPALLSAGLLVVSAILLSFSYLVTEYDDPPNPVELLRLVGEPPEVLKKDLLAHLAQAHTTNEGTISKRFQYLNWGILLFLIGVIVFVVGVVFA